MTAGIQPALTETVPDSDLAGFTEIDRLVHEPARLMLMAVLYVIDSADFTFLMNQTGMTWGNLEEAGYLEGRAAFQAYRLKMKQVLDNLPE
jgi:hypothetical protein